MRNFYRQSFRSKWLLLKIFPPLSQDLLRWVFLFSDTDSVPSLGTKVQSEISFWNNSLNSCWNQAEKIGFAICPFVDSTQNIFSNVIVKILWFMNSRSSSLKCLQLIVIWIIAYFLLWLLHFNWGQSYKCYLIKIYDFKVVL